MTVLLGRQTAGTSGDFNGSGHTALWKFTASASGRLATIFGQTKVANATGTITMGIYDDNAGVANNLLGKATKVGAGTGTGVFSADISSSAIDIVSGTVYWLGWRNSAENMDFQGDTSGFYDENSGTIDFQTPWTAGSSGAINAILWGEDAGITPLIATYRPVRIANSRVGPMALRRKFTKPYILFSPSSGATIFQQALTATVTSTATIQNQINKIVVATSTTTASIQKRINKGLSATVTTVSILQKQANKALNATVTTIASMGRTILKNLVATVTTNSSTQKQVNKPLSATSTTTASIQSTTLKNLVAAVTTTATLQALKVIVVAMVANVSTTATMQKIVNKSLIATSSASASMTRLINKTMSATATVTGIMGAVKAGVVAGVVRGVKFFFSHRGYY